MLMDTSSQLDQTFDIDVLITLTCAYAAEEALVRCFHIVGVCLVIPPTVHGSTPRGKTGGQRRPNGGVATTVSIASDRPRFR